jgi:hypothetical protein
MLKDIKFLKSRIEGKFNKDFNKVFEKYSVNQYFGELELYINSWYCGDEEFIKYTNEQVKDCLTIQQPNYKLTYSILNTGQMFTKLTKQQRKDFTTRLEVNYINLRRYMKI